MKLLSGVKSNGTEGSGCSSFGFVGCLNWWLGRGALRIVTATTARVEATVGKERREMEVVAGMLIFSSNLLFSN